MKRRKMGLPVTLAALALVSVVLVTAFGAVGASGKPAAAAIRCAAWCACG